MPNSIGLKQQRILLAHGSGGRLTHSLIKNLFLKKLRNPILEELSDSAAIEYKERIAFTTDSFVVSPLWFPGGDIGKLAVCGTINDLVMAGAAPEFISLALIIEEGLDYRLLEAVTDSIAKTAKQAGVACVTGDTKVVERGACDKLFINTSGIGRILTQRRLSVKNIKPGDSILVSGNIGQHGLAVLTERKGLGLGFRIRSDCCSLASLLIPILKKTNAVKFMRDPTRGGVATTLNEIAEGLRLGITIEEKNIPVSTQVRSAAELLGIDPLYIANEGIALLVVETHSAERILRLLQRHPIGKNSRIIGRVTKEFKSRVILRTSLGTERIIDMLTSEPLPRIC